IINFEILRLPRNYEYLISRNDKEELIKCSVCHLERIRQLAEESRDFVSSRLHGEISIDFQFLIINF
ncbi:MAG: hypothetical protein RBR98_01630, partial [Candidatus Moranbacteria bacterium]|nr:hypothetical protein [Candidatus Moranbacteria bacterium]